jgi:hypothetical protein
MLLEITIDFGSQNKERFHIITILHDLFAVLDISPHFFAMDVVRTWQLSSLLSLCQHCPNLLERCEFDLWRGMA